MGIVARDLPPGDLQFMAHRNLALEVADVKGHRPDENRFPQLRDPHWVDLEAKFAPQAISADLHAAMLQHSGTRLKARRFDHP